MPVGARLIVLWQELRQKKCARCGLPLKGDSDKCPHCSGLDDLQLEQFLEENRIKFEKKGALGQFLIFAAIIILFIFIVSRIL